MIKTLNQLKEELKIFADSHLQINEFYFGNFNQIYNEKIIRHTFLIADTQNISPNRVRGGGSYTDITFIISACDQVFPDQSNWMDVKSDTFQIIMDCRNIFESPRWKAFSSVQGSPTVTYFEQKGSDRVNGWVMNVTLRIPDLRDLCAIPLVDYNLDSELESLCAGVTIIEDGNYLQTVPSGGTYSYSTGGGGSVTIQVNGEEYIVELAPSTIDIQVRNSSGYPIGIVIPAVRVDIEDTPIKNSAGTLQANAPSGVDYTVSDDTVQNSDSSTTYNDIVQGVIKVIPDITVTAPNGSTASFPSMKNYACTSIPDLATQDLNDQLKPKQISQIQRQEPLRTGQNTIYRTGDDGNLQMGIGATFFLLADNNIWGNNFRFTDETGGFAFVNNFVLDHLSGLMWYRVPTTATQWNGAIDAAFASTLGGFTDWFLPNMNQLISICNFSISTNALLNYAPFNIAVTTSTDRIWTSTTTPNASANAYTLQSNSTFAGTGKSTSQSYIICRKFIPADFGL